MADADKPLDGPHDEPDAAAVDPSAEHAAAADAAPDEASANPAETSEPVAAPMLEAPEAEAVEPTVAADASDQPVEPAVSADPAPEPVADHAEEPTDGAQPMASASTDAEAGDPEPISLPAGAAGAAAAAAAGATARRPIWSDSGDAPFSDRPTRESLAAAPRPAKSDGARSGGNETVEIFKTIIFALAVAFVLRVLFFQPFTIPSASMEPNLYEGDYIVVSKWSYGYSKHSIPLSPPLFEGRIFDRAPSRGDVVVFKLPRDNRTDYIKRVIGLPGDRIQMIANVLHINGRPIPDVQIAQADVDDVLGLRSVTRARETLPNGRSFTIQDYGPGFDLDDTPVYEVPSGHYFMMGDNRDNSIDSRVEQSAGVGLVPEENLVGKAEIILFSWSPGASLWNPVSWFANLRPSRFFTVLN